MAKKKQYLLLLLILPSPSSPTDPSASSPPLDFSYPDFGDSSPRSREIESDNSSNHHLRLSMRLSINSFASISTICSTTPITSFASSGDKIDRIVDELPSPSASAVASHSAKVSDQISSSPVFGSGSDPICHWLFNTYLFPNHHISVDLFHADLFCCSCFNQAYDCNFDSTVVLAQSPSFPSTSSSIVSPSPRSKRRCVDFKQWRSDPSQSHLICARSNPFHADPTTSDTEFLSFDLKSCRTRSIISRTQFAIGSSLIHSRSSSLQF